MAKGLQSGSAFVTGGAVRIGRSLCEALADAGWDIVVHYRNSGVQARELAGRIKEAGRKAWTVRGRLDTEAGCRRVLSDAWRKSGRIGVLVNSASVFEVGGLASSSWQSFKTNFETNLFGPACLMREYASRVARLKSGCGCIVNILDRRVASQDCDSVPYTLSKKALGELTRMAATELAPRIRVNAVAPGSILPPKVNGVASRRNDRAANPLSRVCTPEDVADAVLWLVRASAVTGQTVFVDGGMHLEKQ